MPAGTRIEVHGLRELRRVLNEAADRSPREIGQANKDAAEIVAAEAKRRAPRGPHQGGGKIIPIVDSIRAQGTTRRGAVVFGGQRSPHAPVYEFGGTVPRHHSQSRTHVAKRAYVYPAIDAKQGEVLRAYEQAVGRITRNL